MQSLGNYNSIFNFLLYPEFSGVLLLIKVIFLLVSLVFLAIIVILIFKTRWIKFFIFEDVAETFTARPYGANKIYRDWQMIKGKFASHKENDKRLAIIEADDLLNNLFKQMGYKGDSMTDRLNQIDAKKISNIDKVWQAHKLRNNIVYNPDYKLDRELADKSFEAFEKALRELDIF